MLIYGWGSFCLDKCVPTKLGLPEELDAEYIIEKRQKYFHLFWIPFFPIGKKWVLRNKNDKQLYEPNEDLLKFLKSIPIIHKTPWYTYSLLLIGIAVGLGFYINDLIN